MKYDSYLSGNVSRIGKAINTLVNRAVLDRILKLTTNRINLMEIGPGRGDFYKLCVNSGNIKYSCYDINLSVVNKLKALGADSNELTKNVFADIRTDVFYAAHVFEHFNNHCDITEFILSAKRTLENSGIFVTIFPDYKSWKDDFWDVDYTHTVPITENRMSQILYDNGFGIIYKRCFYGPFRYWPGVFIDKINRLVSSLLLSFFPHSVKLKKLRNMFHGNIFIIASAKNGGTR